MLGLNVYYRSRKDVDPKQRPNVSLFTTTICLPIKYVPYRTITVKKCVSFVRLSNELCILYPDRYEGALNSNDVLLIRNCREKIPETRFLTDDSTNYGERKNWRERIEEELWEKHVDYCECFWQNKTHKNSAFRREQTIPKQERRQTPGRSHVGPPHPLAAHPGHHCFSPMLLRQNAMQSARNGFRNWS